MRNVIKCIKYIHSIKKTIFLKNEINEAKAKKQVGQYVVGYEDRLRYTTLNYILNVFIIIQRNAMFLRMYFGFFLVILTFIFCLCTFLNFVT